MSTGSVFMSDVFLSSFSAAWQCLHTLITSGVFQGPSRSARYSTASPALAPNPPHTLLSELRSHTKTQDFNFFFSLPPPLSTVIAWFLILRTPSSQDWSSSQISAVQEEKEEEGVIRGPAGGEDFGRGADLGRFGSGAGRKRE